MHPISADALKPALEKFKAPGKPFKMAMVFPVSTHNYELRYWLAAGGINPGLLFAVRRDRPDRAPTCCSRSRRRRRCRRRSRPARSTAIRVGEPWNQQAIFKGVGVPVITDYEIWKNNPEKVFGVTKAFADKNPNTHIALVKALIRAGDVARRQERREPQGGRADPLASRIRRRRLPRDRQQHDRHVRVRPRRQARAAGLQRLLPLPRHLSVLLATPSGTSRRCAAGARSPRPSRTRGTSRPRRRSIGPTCIVRGRARAGRREGKAKAADFPSTSDGFRAPTKEFIDGIEYDGRKPNAYIEKLAIGLKGQQKIESGNVVGK